MRDITIHAVMNGYIVQVGCQTLVFQGREHLLAELRRYLERPEDVEKEYLERFPIDQPHAGQVAISGGALGGSVGYAARADMTRVSQPAASGQRVYAETNPAGPPGYSPEQLQADITRVWSAAALGGGQTIPNIPPPPR